MAHMPTQQMLIVCLAGVGASVAAGSAEALTLVSITLCVQLLVFLWVACLFPSSDRVDNFAVGLGWGGESSSMLLLVLASFFPSLRTGTLETASYALSLLGVGDCDLGDLPLDVAVVVTMGRAPAVASQPRRAPRRRSARRRHSECPPSVYWMTYVPSGSAAPITPR